MKVLWMVYKILSKLISGHCGLFSGFGWNCLWANPFIGLVTGPNVANEMFPDVTYNYDVVFLYIRFRFWKKKNSENANHIFFFLFPFLHPPTLLLYETWCSAMMSSKKMSSNYRCMNPQKKILVKSMCDKTDPAVKESDSDTIIMVIVLVAGVGGVFILFALMALCYR